MGLSHPQAASPPVLHHPQQLSVGNAVTVKGDSASQDVPSVSDRRPEPIGEDLSGCSTHRTSFHYANNSQSGSRTFNSGHYEGPRAQMINAMPPLIPYPRRFDGSTSTFLLSSASAFTHSQGPFLLGQSSASQGSYNVCLARLIMTLSRTRTVTLRRPAWREGVDSGRPRRYVGLGKHSLRRRHRRQLLRAMVA